MKVAVYRQPFTVQGLDFYTANPDTKQEQSDGNFLGYLDLTLEQPNKYRWFVHRDKFKDSTAYLEWRGVENGGMFIIKNDGSADASVAYSLNHCRRKR